MGPKVLLAPAMVVVTAMASTMAEAIPVYPKLVGVNIAGGDFAGNKIPGKFSQDYAYPDDKTIDYFQASGMTTIRMPFRWERLQRSLGSALDSVELSRIDAVVSYATSKGLSIILDPHNFASYGGQKIGTAAVPNGDFASFWAQLAAHYEGNDKVIFGLMNEPSGVSAVGWADSAQTAVNAIRATGADNLILVPGNAFTGAHSWMQQNAAAFSDFVDPGDNMAFEVHQYLDNGFSGTSSQCKRESIGVDTLTAFTDWLYETGSRGFLGEFAGGANPTCLAALDDMLDYVSDNGKVWLGWTYWAAGAMWPPDYMFSVQPTADGRDRPQMDVLLKYAALAHDVPEPASFGLLGLGLLGLGAILRCRSNLLGPVRGMKRHLP